MCRAIAPKGQKRIAQGRATKGSATLGNRPHGSTLCKSKSKKQSESGFCPLQGRPFGVDITHPRVSARFAHLALGYWLNAPLGRTRL